MEATGEQLFVSALLLVGHGALYFFGARLRKRSGALAYFGAQATLVMAIGLFSLNLLLTLVLGGTLVVQAVTLVIRGSGRAGHARRNRLDE